MTINPTQLRWSQGGRWSTRKALHPWYKGLMGLRLAWEGSPACNHWSTGVLYGQLHCRLVEFIPKREFTPKGNRRSRDRASHPRVARVMGLCSRFFKYRALPVENNLTIMLNGVQLHDPSWSESVLTTKAWFHYVITVRPILSYPFRVHQEAVWVGPTAQYCFSPITAENIYHSVDSFKSLP